MRRFDHTNPANMTEGQRRDEIVALLSGALCRIGQKKRKSSRNSESGPCCGPENTAQCDLLVSGPMEKVARATEATAANTKKLVQKAHDMRFG